MLEVGSRSKAVVVWFGRLALSLLVLLTSTACAGEWKAHEVRRINGTAGEIRFPAEFQIVTESWNRVVAVPYLAYIPEKQRLLMLVSCDYPHHPEVLFSDDHGATWSPPKPAIVGAEGKPVAGLGRPCVTWAREARCSMAARAGSVAITARRGKSPYRWSPFRWQAVVHLGPSMMERDPITGKISRLVETDYTWFKPPEVDDRASASLPSL